MALQAEEAEEGVVAEEEAEGAGEGHRIEQQHQGPPSMASLHRQETRKSVALDKVNLRLVILLLANRQPLSKTANGVPNPLPFQKLSA